MKDVFCINLSSLPKQSFFELSMKISEVFSVLFTHFGIADSVNKFFSGRLGPKGKQKLREINYEDNPEISVNSFSNSPIRNAVFEESNVFSYKRYASGCQFILIIDEVRENDIDLNLLMSVFADESVYNAYCFKSEGQTLPSWIFKGVNVGTINLSKKRRTHAENVLTLALDESIRRGKNLRLTQLFPKMYVRTEVNRQIEEICIENNYKMNRCQNGVLIDMTNESGYTVSVTNRENALFKTLKELGFVYSVDSSDNESVLELLDELQSKK